LIYIAHRHETSNALNASLRCEQKRLQRLSETVPTNSRIPQAVRQGIPDRRTSHTESPLAIGAELVTRYDQEVSGGASEMLTARAEFKIRTTSECTFCGTLVLMLYAQVCGRDVPDRTRLCLNGVCSICVKYGVYIHLMRKLCNLHDAGNRALTSFLSVPVWYAHSYAWCEGDSNDGQRVLGGLVHGRYLPSNNTWYLSTMWYDMKRCVTYRLIVWRNGRTSLFDRRTFLSCMGSTHSWQVTTYVGKQYAVGQPTRPTQPFVLLGSIDE